MLPTVRVLSPIQRDGRGSRHPFRRPHGHLARSSFIGPCIHPFAQTIHFPRFLGRCDSMYGDGLCATLKAGDLPTRLERKQACSSIGAPWTKWNGPNQLWKFDRIKPPVPFEFNKPYNVSVLHIIGRSNINGILDYKQQIGHVSRACR